MANLKQVSVSVAFRSVLERCHDFLVSHTHTHTHERWLSQGAGPRPHALCLALIVCIYFCFINKIVSFEPSLLLIKRHWAVSLYPERARGAGHCQRHCPMGSPPCLAVPAGAVAALLLVALPEMLHFDCRRGVALRMVRVNYKKCCCLHMIVTNI